ncbi:MULTISPECIES: hypothetical protein [Pseudolactococcus]|uniref:Uncharacterized protein n=1 Tax=Pseudolactococcus piscium MKFS47 TaxID=297352 RepID=A0A0D6DWS0_9LACT|nr:MULTISPECIES: hypothetical protein [Lactococcus]MCJ1972309.1 hypothetical protein [Lactococcus carnosus]CEN28172.1 Uncharacterized protein LACPI_0972 [Lactococcus piscium MKFS47]
MSNVIEIVSIIVVIGFQTFCGYIKNKYLGSILPIMFILFIGYFLFEGSLAFNFRDIIMPFIGTFTLLMIYQGGKEAKENKIKKELDKMKAKDISETD